MVVAVQAAAKMKFKHSITILPSSSTIAKVTALTWSPNGRKLAAVTIGRVVHLFDESGALKEKFATKPADPKGCKLYIVVGMVFSPDSTKLAIGQSDDIIFIYKLGLEWGEKKSICNKFQQTLPINSLIWPGSSQIEIMFGLSDGKVKVGQLRTNRTATLYAHGASSPVVSLACSPDGCTCLAGHLDGSIYRFSLDKTTGNFATKFADYGSVPTVLGWAKNVVIAAGSDSKVALYDFSGAVTQLFDFANERGFNSVTFNSTADIAILGCYNGFHIFQNSGLTDVWEDSGWHEVKNLYTVSAVSWKPDGSQVAIGGLCGTLDLYDAYLKKQQYNEKFEFVFVSKSQVILTQLSQYTRMLLQSQFRWEILRIDIYMEQYLIAYTEETLLLGNLDNCKLSEIMWHASGLEKFLVDNPSVCLIHNNGELFLVEYGCNDILTTVQTDLFQEALISVRLDRKFSSAQLSEHGNNRLAYLLDLQTVQVKDIVSCTIIDTISHTYEIVWLQLNPRASHLLLCDKKRHLHLFELGNHECVTLLNICNFVQWVPDTNVIVAQSDMTLYIWYNIQSPQHVTKFPLKGDLEGVRRVQGHMEVLVYEGLNTVAYELDEALIDVGSALEKCELDNAFCALDPLELTIETQQMWKQLAEKALQQKKLLCAQKSFASCGDISCASYLRKIYKQVTPVLRVMEDDDKKHSLMQINLVALLQNWEDVEKRLLEQGNVEDAVKMYTNNYRWKEALSISQPGDFSNGKRLSRLYLQWLLKTRQVEEAGKEIASSGEIAAAVNVFLNSNLLGLAADYALKLPSNLCKGVLLERIDEALTGSGMLGKLGEFMESLGDYDKAQHAYQKGHFFHHALKLAEKKFKGDVIKVEEMWGDWLVSKNEMEASIAHYVEAGCCLKAIDSAIACHQWAKATQIADQQNNEVVKPIYIRLAQYFAKIKQFDEAERLFISAELPSEALSMYLKASKYEAAQKVAFQLLSSDEARLIYMREAKEHEVLRRFKDAEKLYLEAGQHDFAINMYKAEGMFDNVIQIVAKFKKDGLHETHLYLAQELERKGMLLDAEHHYLEVREWKSIVKMYSASAMWEDALRIAKSWGGAPATKQVAYAWAISVNESSGLQSVTRLGLINEAIDYAVDISAFSNAFQLCEVASMDKQQEVQVKFAKFLEAQGRFQESEDILIKAGKPMEAINMYVQEEDWKAALRVADIFQPSAVADVQVFQAQALVENNELKKAETLFVQAKKPKLAIQMYKERNLWDDAIRVAQKFMPAGLSEIQNYFAAFLQSKSGGGDSSEFVLAKAKAAESSQDFQKAIDLYVGMDLKSLPDMERLQKVWRKALELTKEYAKNRMSEVMHVIGEQLISAGQYQEAAQLYLEYDEYKEAVDVFILGGHWGAARKVAEDLGHQHLSEHIESMYKEHLLRTGATGLPGSGSAPEALDTYYSEEDWDKVYELLASMGPEAQKDCSVRHAAHCLQNFKVFEAISVLSRYGLPSTAEGSELCGGITSQLLHSCSDTSVSLLAMQEFRSLLYNHVQSIKGSTSPDSQAVEYLEGMLIPVTYMILHFSCHQKGLKELATKLLVSLLRFIPSIPADKAFYEAGMACKEVGWKDKAFFFLNQYLDIAEAIDDGETDIAADHPIVSKSDIPPTFAIPQRHFVDVDKQEDIQDWVIQFSVNQQEEKSSLMRECKACEASIYEASLCCFNCQDQSKPCCVTGYPVDQDACTECQFCHMPANKCDWTTFIEVFHSCPWCNTSLQASH